MRKQHEYGKTAHDKVASAILIEYGECREWPFGRDDRGYGRVSGSGSKRTMFTHRAALETKLGRPLKEGKFACHTCDNPPCCRSEHLYEGDYPDNARDARLRDRVQHGEGHWKRRLTEEDVRQIRKWIGRISQREMGRRLGVHDNTIRDVIKGRTWVRVK